MKKHILVTSAFICTLLLSACQTSPKKDAVISQNDGSFDANMAQSAEQTHAYDETEALSYFDAFSSTDGSVIFQFEVENSISTPNMPVVEVAPHILSEEDVRNAAYALCGVSALFYEAEPTLNEQYTKSDVAAQIGRWSPYASTEGMKYLFPNGSPENWESDAQVLRDGIVYLTNTYLDENAPNYQHAPCQWTFKKSSHYLYGSENAEGATPAQDNDEISAWVYKGEGRYGSISASRRDKEDFKLNNIYYDATISGPLGVEYALLRAEKLRTGKPTEDQIEFAVTNAQQIIDGMDLGTWKVELSHIGVYSAGEETEYLIHLTAVPVLERVAAIHRPQLNNLKSDTAYASNYYLTEAIFDYAADGTLMNFILYSPVDVKQVVNENVKTLTSDQLFSRAKEHLSLSDAHAYGAALDQTEEKYLCTVNITRVEYGLARTKAPNTDESYYYVPAATFRGNIDYHIQSENQSFYFREDVPLLMLNAVDGSIIPLYNE